MVFEHDVAVVGGCGRAGLPLGIALASRGLNVVIYDIDARAVDTINAAKMPFSEEGAQELLETVAGTTLHASLDASAVATAEHVVVVIGTPVDEHLNPEPHLVVDLVRDLRPQLRDGQHLLLRSTVFPGTTAAVERAVRTMGLDVDVSFCPERIAEGRAMTELFTLPQLVSGRTPRAIERASALFSLISPSTIPMTPEDAELAKLFTNAYRYIKFAAANQFFVMAEQLGLDYEAIRAALADEYPRAADLPSAGLAAGPCLLKDTMQLAAFANHDFPLGYAAMLMNEGLPLQLVTQLEKNHDLSTMTVGLLGMAFKGESDDARGSLSYKLKRLLRFRANEVLCHDPYVTSDPDLRSLDDVLSAADLLVIGAPHERYRSLDFEGPILDIWRLRS